MKRDIAELYSYFVTKTYDKYTFFQLTINDRANRVIVSFLVELEKRVGIDSIDKDYLYDFVAFQFYYMRSKVPRYNESRIPLSQIFSYKGIERWLCKSDGYMYYVHKDFEERGGRRIDVINSSIITRGVDELIEEEEREKKRFYNQRNGLAHCIQSTSLYNSKSELCERCTFKELCKQLLKETNYALYIDRDYV